MNKYQEFMQAVGNLQNEKLKHHCYTLVASTRVYIATYKEFSLYHENIWRVIAQYYKYDEITKKTSQKESQKWNIPDRFIIYLYYWQKKKDIEGESYICDFTLYNDDKRLSLADREILKKQGLTPKKAYSFNTFINTIFSSRKLLNADLDAEYSLYSPESQTKTQEELEVLRREEEKIELIRQCFDHWQEFKKTQNSSSFSENSFINFKKLEKAVQLYLATDISEININKYSYEECFNNTFSERYVRDLIQIMKTQEVILPMYITPTIDELIGEREKVAGKFGDYEEGLRRWTTPEYKRLYNKYLTYYQKPMDELAHIYRLFLNT